MTEEREELMSPGEVATLFGVDSDTVTLWANNGKLEVITRTLGRHRRYSKDEVTKQWKLVSRTGTAYNSAELMDKVLIGKVKLVNTVTVAELFGVSPKTIRLWANERKLSYVLTLDGHYRFLEFEVQELLKES